MKTEEKAVLPENYIVKQIGPFRIIRHYYRYSNHVIENYLILERSFKNKMNESYFSKAIINPRDEMGALSSEDASRLVNEYSNLLSELMEAIVK